MVGSVENGGHRFRWIAQSRRSPDLPQTAAVGPFPDIRPAISGRLQPLSARDPRSAQALVWTANPDKIMWLSDVRTKRQIRSGSVAHSSGHRDPAKLSPEIGEFMNRIGLA